MRGGVPEIGPLISAPACRTIPILAVTGQGLGASPKGGVSRPGAKPEFQIVRRASLGASSQL